MADLSILVSPESARIAEQLVVPTRIYFPSGTVPIEPATNPAFDAAWNETASAVRRKMVVDGRKRGTSAASVTATSGAANPEKHLWAQYVSQPLRAQTIAGNVRAQFRASESNTGLNATLQVGIRVVSNDGGTVLATLLAVGGSTTTTATPPEFATSLTNRRLLTAADATPLGLTSYACKDGDRLVIEVGFNDKSTSATQTASCSFGDNTSDLTTDDTATGANDPWLEFDSTILFENAVERLKVADSGTTQLMNQGWVKLSEQTFAAIDPELALPAAEALKLADSVSAALGELFVPIAAESLKISESLTARGELGAAASESLKLADTVAATLDPLNAPLADEALHVQDAVTALQVLLANVSETLKLSDIGRGLTSLIGVLRLSDEDLSAALVTGNNLATSVPDENVRIIEAVATARTLEVLVAAEACSVADAVSPSRDLTATPAEALRPDDAAALLRELDPLQAAATEAGKLADTATGSFSISAQVAEALRVADAATPALDPLEVQRQEIAKIADGPPLGDGALSGQPTDDESVHVGEELSVTLFPLQTAQPSELLRLSDAAITPAKDLSVQAPTENLRGSDKVNILSANLSEELKMRDAGALGMGITALFGVVHITDTVVAGLSNTLGALPAAEGLRVADAPQAVRTPLEAALTETVRIGYAANEVEYTRDEYARVSEQLTAALGAVTDLFTSLQDQLKLADVPTPARTIDAVPAEALAVADAVTPARTLEVAAAQEAVLLADAPAAARDLTATPAEALRAADGPAAGYHDPLEVAAPAEQARLFDFGAADSNVGADVLSVLVNPERLTLADAAALAMDLAPSLTEALRVAEDLQAEGPPILATASEALAVADAAVPALDPLNASVAEAVRIAEQVSATLALVVVVDAELLRKTDDAGDFLVGLDLAADFQPLELESALVETVHMSEHAHAARPGRGRQHGGLRGNVKDYGLTAS